MTDTKVVGRGRIARLLLSRDAIPLGSTELRLEVTLSDEEGEVLVAFGGVKGLRFRGETTELLENVVLMIEEIGERQWDDVSYRVSDVEEEVLSFFCKTFEAPA